MHYVEPEDLAARKMMCADLLETVVNQNLIENVECSDKAIFHTCGSISRHNCRIWADYQPSQINEWKRNTPKVNVLMGITKERSIYL